MARASSPRRRTPSTTASCVPGSPVHAEEVHDFEETSDDPLACVRSSFCLRTPVSFLHGKRGAGGYTRDPHTKNYAPGACEETMLARVDSVDDTFRSRIAEERCVLLDHAQSKGTQGAGRVWFLVPHDLGESRWAKIDLSHAREINIGLTKHEQMLRGGVAMARVDAFGLLGEIEAKELRARRRALGFVGQLSADGV